MLALAAAAVLVVGPAAATRLSEQLSRRVGPPTTPLTVTVAGLSPGEAVSVAFARRTLAQGNADQAGVFEATIAVPAWARPGTHHVTATAGADSVRRDFLVRTNWSQLGAGPTHLGLNRFENVLSRSNVGTLRQLWLTPFANHASPTSPQAAVGAGLVFVCDQNGILHALDANTGATVWTYEFADQVLASSPAVADGTLYFTLNGSVIAFDARTGSVVWGNTFANSPGSPAVANGRVYVAAADLNVFDRTDGRLLWQGDLDAATGTTPAVDPLTGVAVVGTNLGTFYAFDANGGKLWSLQLGTNAILGNPTIADGIVYIGNMDGQFFALDEATGKTLWQQPIGGGRSPDGVSTTPAISGSTVYVTAGVLYAFDKNTGAKLWTTSVDSGSDPAIANGVVYVTGRTPSLTPALFTVDASTGAILATATIDESLVTGASVANGIVYFGGNQGNFFAYSTG
ncbi:MAG TPA: PQQ-binding-like beta-propeller repeat protein [Gaiellaceae bacterium]